MEKTLKIGKKEVRLSNNFSWAIIYRDQFGHDIVSTLTPMLAAGLDIVSGTINEAADADGKVEIANLLKVLDGDTLIDAVIHLSGFESIEIAYIMWAMAKACDDDIPDPKTWIKGFDVFPMDTIVPEVFTLAFKGLVSSKNLKRLKDLKKSIKVVQPELTSTQSSSQDSNED
jgi:hypothetical protein